MAKPTVPQLQARYETDLEAADLALAIDAAYQEITDRYGADASQVDILAGGHRQLFLSRKASAVTSVVETIGDTDTTLAADDYSITESSWALKRLDDGTNQRRTWGTEVTVTYQPVTDAQRVEACLRLAILYLQYQGVEGATEGNVTTAFPEYEKHRMDILRTLSSTRRGFA